MALQTHPASELVAADGRRCEDKLRAETVDILESISEGFVSLDASWRFTYVNGRAERIFDVRRENLLGQDFWQMFPAAIGTAFEREYRQAMTGRVPVRVEELYKPLGRWFEVSVVPARDGGITFYLRDISSRKQTAAIVGGQKQALELALQGAPLPSILAVLTRTVEAQQPWLHDVPLVALTGWGQEEDRRRARAAGFDHHLVKPVDVDALQSLLVSLKAGSTNLMAR